MGEIRRRGQRGVGWGAGRDLEDLDPLQVKLKVAGRGWASRVEIGAGVGLAPALLSVRSILQGSQPGLTSTALHPYLVTAPEHRNVSQERLTNPLGKKLFTSRPTKTLWGWRERDSRP